MFQFWLLLCNSACRYSQISLNSTSQAGESNNNLRTQNPLPRLSYLFVCVGAKVFAAAAAVRSASIPAQTGNSSAFECERKQTTSLAEHFALFCISASAPTRELSFSRALTLHTPPLSLSLCFTKLPAV